MLRTKPFYQHSSTRSIIKCGGCRGAGLKLGSGSTRIKSSTLLHIRRELRRLRFQSIVGLVVAIGLSIAILDISAVGVDAAAADDGETTCGLWMGPSSIKDIEDHGYGLGMYTGRFLPAGSLTSREIAIPFFDYDEQTFDDTPLREYVWNGEGYKPLVLESNQGMEMFIPGLAGIAPCTSNNFNLELVHPQDLQLTFDDMDLIDGEDSVMTNNNIHDINNYAGGYDVHRSHDATAGSFSRYHIRQFRAVRDIHPGEELVVECSDDDFDGSTHALNKYDPSNSKTFCLDDKVELKKLSSKPKIGDGVFAKRLLSENEIVLSSPAVPIHKSVLDIKTFSPPGKQLIMNYCYGHPDSDLLWLPYGPIFNGINHADDPLSANVKVQWHHDSTDNDGHYDPQQLEELSRRKQYHHPELLSYTVDRVSDTHGKGLVMDLVATRPIGPDEELFLDYGPSWRKSWSEFETKWRTDVVESPFPNIQSQLHEYVPAMLYNIQHSKDKLRTISEQRHEPYPRNLITACRFERDWIDDEYAQDYDLIQYHSWYEQTEHMSCLLPCMILERIQGDDDNISYTAKLIDKQHDNINIEWECHIFKRFEYIYTDIPRQSIEFIEKVYKSDPFMVGAFRHPIQVPDGMYPDHWLRPNTTTTTSATASPVPSPKSILRGRRAAAIATDSVPAATTTSAPNPQNATAEERLIEESFKRKKRPEPLFDREEMKRKKLASSAAEEL
mmetsp:Transcript_51055/g.123179  ORF Transcript_51055/g.123179 Transcript_51055/m.123179 type:complete len:725 (+) Transcript_51055:170-2344(+)